MHLKLCTLLAYTRLLNLEQFPHVQGATKGIYIHADANLNKVSHVSVADNFFCEHADAEPGSVIACTRDTPSDAQQLILMLVLGVTFVQNARLVKEEMFHTVVVMVFGTHHQLERLFVYQWHQVVDLSYNNH